MNILSLFDGMACGMIAMQKAGIEVERYVAYEIDKYAVQTSSHNFPMIEHRGDVFKADFTEFEGFDFLVGGSPCTYWSIAQKNNRETEASGMGWELFSQYVRALHEAKPRFFVYENNKSMSKAIRASIDEAFGFEAVCINSALVSAQNRQRLYWVGKRNEDGTYSKVDIEQPEDRGILLKDVLESGQTYREKANCLCGNRGGTSLVNDLTGSRHNYAAEPVGTTVDGKTCVAEPIASCVLNINPSGHGINGAVSRIDTKSRCLTTNKGEGQKIIVPVAEPINVTEDGKSQTLKAQYCKNSVANFCCYSSTYGASGVAEPIRVGTWPNNAKNQEHDSQQYRIYSTEGKAVTQCGNGGGMGAKTGLYACPVHPGIGELTHVCDYDVTPQGTLRVAYTDESESQGYRVYSPEHKSVCLRYANGRGTELVADKIHGLATPCEWDENGKPIKAISAADGKTYPVYEVKDGQITIKGKQYPIKLTDGFYIIRKLTVRECMRLQTVPEWYEFPVSDSQAYKMLGNGWSCDVICWLLTACMEANEVSS